MRSIGLVLLLFPAVIGAAEPPLAIRNATVETLAVPGRLEGVTVVVRDGKIAVIAKDAALPDNATVLDAAGGTLMPGVIDPYFEVAIAGATADAGPRTVVIGGRTITIPGGAGRTASGYTRIADNFYPYDDGFKSLPRVGLTRLSVVSSGMGQAALIRVTPAEPQRMLEQPDGFAYASVTNATDSLDQLRTRLAAAARSGRDAPASGRPGGFGGAASTGARVWTDVIEGKVPLVVECSGPAAVLHLLKAIETYKAIKPVLFLGGDSVAETTAALKERKVTVLLRPGLDLLPNTRDRFSPARMLHEAGIDFVFSLTARPPQGGGAGGAAAGDDASTRAIDPDAPFFPVAMLVKTGLPRTKALEALTKKPATILGLDKTHGTIEIGKAADLLLFSGDPLDPESRLLRTIIDGRVVYAY